MAEIKTVRFRDDTGKVIKRITTLTDRKLRDATEDATKLIKQMMRDKFRVRSTGRLAASVVAEHPGVLQHRIVTPGVHYAAAQEWGWHPRGSNRKRKGQNIILRGFWGMIRRYERGGRWEDR